MKRYATLLVVLFASAANAQVSRAPLFTDSAVEVRYRIADADTNAVLSISPVSSLDYLRRAIVLFERNRDDEGARVYFAGIGAWEDSLSANAYTDDALVTGADEEIVPLTDGSLRKRATALRLFWKKRAVRDGVTIPGRIGEHYRRIAYARRNYRFMAATAPRSRYVIVRRDGVAKELDDRGVIYVKFGKPLNQLSDQPSIRRDTPYSVQLEAWFYGYAQHHAKVFYFKGGRIEANLAGDGAANSDPVTGSGAFFEDLARLDPRYGFMEARLQTMHTAMFSLTSPMEKRQKIADLVEDMARLNARITEDNAMHMGRAIDTDRALPVFVKPLPTYHDFATFRGKGCTDVVYSIMAQAPAYELSVAVADTFTWETEAVETRVARGTPAGGYLRSTGVFCTQPRNNAYMRFTVRADDNRGVTEGGEIRIADYRGSDLMMSDLLFATTAPGPFIRGNARLAIIPPRQFMEGEAFRVFYELYNLPRGARYRTDITFKTIESGVFTKIFKGQKKTTVSFEDEARTDDVVQELRTLVPQVEPGKVEVTISVTNLATQQKATSKENIYILAKEK